MSKFRVKMKLTGFEIEIEGSRDDMPLISQGVKQQIAGLLDPAGAIVEGEIVPERRSEGGTERTPEDSTGRRKGRVRRARVVSNADAASEAAVDWRHDAAKYGSPRQDWNTGQKALWLLYVAANEANVGEMSGARIATTFNKHFRQAGLIKTGHINRDLGRMKTARKNEPPFVSEDTRKQPPTWFLTDGGTRAAQRLIAEALGSNASD